MNSKEIQGVMKAWQEVMEKKTLDPVNKKALDKDFDDREDKDIDNDGDTDSSDEYLHNRRKTIKKAIKKESIELDEEELDEISAKLARSARDKAKASELDHKIKAYNKISKTKNIPVISKLGKKAAEPDIKMADRRKRQANLANRKLGGMGDYEYDDKGKYRKQGPAKVLAKEEVELNELDYETLHSYAKKNTQSALKGTMPSNKSAQRTTGLNRALDKMKKQDKKYEDQQKESFDCAKQVASEQWGFGECIPGQYSLVEYTDGSVEVTHYDVMFEHGVEFDVPVEELTVLMSETYEYVTESEELGESTSVSEFEEVVVDAYQQRSRGMRGALEQMWEAAAQAKTGVDGKYQETMKSKFKGKGANDMAKDANMDNPELAADDAKGHEDATKAGRVVKGQAPARPGEKRMGDIKILRPVQGAVTKTTGKE